MVRVGRRTGAGGHTSAAPALEPDPLSLRCAFPTIGCPPLRCDDPPQYPPRVPTAGVGDQAEQFPVGAREQVPLLRFQYPRVFAEDLALAVADRRGQRRPDPDVAVALDDRIELPGDELEEAVWFEKGLIREALQGKHRDRVWMPPPHAIAHQLIKSWASVD